MNGTDFFKNKIVQADLGAAVLALLLFAAECIRNRQLEPAFLLPIALAWVFLLLLYLLCRRSCADAADTRSEETRRLQSSITAHRLHSRSDLTQTEDIPAEELRKGELFLVRSGELFPADGEIVEGTASVDESAITGESVAVLREADSDRRFVTCGTTLLSEYLVVRATKSSRRPVPQPADSNALLSELGSESKSGRKHSLFSIFFLIFVLAVFILTVAYLDGIQLSLLEMLNCILILFVALTPLASSAFLRAVDLGGMDRLCRLRFVPKEGRALLLLGQMKKLFVAKGLVFSARTEGVRLPHLRSESMRDAFEAIRRMGVDVVLLCSDDAVNAAELAASAGAAHFIADAGLPEQLEAIRAAQTPGTICGMLGASLSDAPALAQADLAVAMENGAAEAREAANVIDLDSQPEKIRELLRVGKETHRCKRSMVRIASVCELLKLVVLLLFLLQASLFGLTLTLVISIVQTLLLFSLAERACRR